MSRKLTADEARDLKEFSKAAFEEFDKDKSGEIEAKEFESILKQYNESSQCKEKLDEAKIKQTTADFIKLADKNADGKVNHNELYKFFLEALNAHE